MVASLSDKLYPLYAEQSSTGFGLFAASFKVKIQPYNLYTQTTCLNLGIEYKGIGVGAIKKHATGNGHSKKDAMIASASLKFKSVNVIDDNHADALWLLDYAKTIIQ